MARPLSNKKDRNDGSPKNGEPLFLIIGKIRKPHGVRGELLVEILTEFPERIKPDGEVFLGEKKHVQEIETVRFTHTGMLLKFKDIDDRDKAGIFRNQLVYIEAVNLPKLPEDEYYFHELIGMKVKTQEGELLGSVNEVLETGANDVLVVTCSGKEELIPFIEQVIVNINKEDNEIIIKKQEWK